MDKIPSEKDLSKIRFVLKNRGLYTPKGITKLVEEMLVEKKLCEFALQCPYDDVLEHGQDEKKLDYLNTIIDLCDLVGELRFSQ